MTPKRTHSTQRRWFTAAVLLFALVAGCANSGDSSDPANNDSRATGASAAADSNEPVVPAGAIETRSTYATLESSTLYEGVADKGRTFAELTTLTDVVREQTYGVDPPADAAARPALLDPLAGDDLADLADLQNGARTLGTHHDLRGYGAATGPAGWIQLAAEIGAQRALNPVRITRFLAAVATAMQEAVVLNRANTSDPEPRADNPKLDKTTEATVRVSPEEYSTSGPDDAMAAASAAAHTIVALAPESTERVTTALKHQRDNELLSGRWSPADIDAATELGRAASARIMARLSADGAGSGPAPYVPADGATWVPSPPLRAPALDPGAGTWKPWTTCVPDQALPPPPAVGSAEFAAAVQALVDVSESLDDMTRMQAEMWGLGPGTITPPGHWIVEFAKFLEADDVIVEDQAAALAMLTTIEADAGIAIWREKYRYGLIRPIDVIQNTIDRTWQPLLVTPNFPAYPSGHSGFSAAGALLIGTLSPRDAGQAAIDAAAAGDSRILGGIHYWFDNAQGMRLGEAITRSCLAAAGITPLERASAIPLANYASAPRAEADETDNTTGSSAPSSTSAATTSPAT